MDDGSITIKTKKQKVKKMDMKNQIEEGAKVIGLSVEEATSKLEEICSENGIETSNPIALGLWRNFVANTRRAQKSGNDTKSNESFYKNAFGFFVSLDAPRDTMDWSRRRAKEEFLRDSDNALEKGIVAVATKNALGKWIISRYHKGEYREATRDDLPEGAETLEDERVYIPLNATEVYQNGGKNEDYGKPLPKELFRRTGIFFGQIGNGEMKPYFFSYKNQGGVDFKPNTFEWCHFLCVLNENGTDIYGATDLTFSSLTMNAEMDKENDLYRDMSSFDFEDCLRNNFDKHLYPLVELERAHIELLQVNSKERFVITDGTVCNMNMTPTKNGNRIINLTDLNAEISYDDDAITTCWIPEHLTLDFGIGSSVIVIGRTSQRTTDEGVEPITINVAGLYCVIRHGSAVEVAQPVEEDFDWF